MNVDDGTFAAGDTINLDRGGNWTGSLCPGGSGAPGLPINIRPYGHGARPRIDGDEKFLSTLYLNNVQGWNVTGLEITNSGPRLVPNLAGVDVTATDFGVVNHVHLTDLFVHDVDGSNDKNAGGGSGIYCSVGGSKVRTAFNDLLIEGCHLKHTDRNGITMGGNWARDTWFPSQNVVIRGNLLENIGGDGIVPIGCDGAIVEHNVLRGGRMRALDYAAGIWPWGCDNTVVQYNDVSGMKGTNDGEGYDCDYDCKNTLFQYNYSHNNDGGFMLICNDGSQHLPYNAGNVGSRVRYNVSVDDGLHIFNISGPCLDTQIYNNTVYIGKGSTVPIVAEGNWGGDYASNTAFVNNLFYSAGDSNFVVDQLHNTRLVQNDFWGKFDKHLARTGFLHINPHFDLTKNVVPKDLKPVQASQLTQAGSGIVSGGVRDYLGTRINSQHPPVGALK